MKIHSILFALISSLVPIEAALAAPPAGSPPTAAAAPSDSDRIAFLVAQDQRHSADIARLEAANELRPKTKMEAFASCMQAARGQTNPMVAESIGEHCDRLLK
jgi:hypothetical protein